MQVFVSTSELGVSIFLRCGMRSLLKPYVVIICCNSQIPFGHKTIWDASVITALSRFTQFYWQLTNITTCLYQLTGLKTGGEIIFLNTTVPSVLQTTWALLEDMSSATCHTCAPLSSPHSLCMILISTKIHWVAANWQLSQVSIILRDNFVISDISETEDNISHVSSQPDQSLNHCLLWLLTLEINLEVKHLLSVEEIVIGCEYNRLTICQETFSDNKQTEEREDQRVRNVRQCSVLLVSDQYARRVTHLHNTHSLIDNHGLDQDCSQCGSSWEFDGILPQPPAWPDQSMFRKLAQLWVFRSRSSSTPLCSLWLITASSQHHLLLNIQTLFDKLMISQEYLVNKWKMNLSPADMTVIQAWPFSWQQDLKWT